MKQFFLQSTPHAMCNFLFIFSSQVIFEDILAVSSIWSVLRAATIMRLHFWLHQVFVLNLPCSLNCKLLESVECFGGSKEALVSLMQLQRHFGRKVSLIEQSNCLFCTRGVES